MRVRTVVAIVALVLPSALSAQRIPRTGRHHPAEPVPLSPQPGPIATMLAYKRSRRWYDVRSPDINEYLKEATGDDFSAKNFRTWAATVLAAIGLAVSGEVAATATGRKRAVTRAVKEVSGYLGNTPAVCRASYIDPRVIDAYNGGLTISGVLEEIADTDEVGETPIHQPVVEQAVLDLINERESSPALERVAA
jgi:hypothetical protein